MNGHTFPGHQPPQQALHIRRSSRGHVVTLHIDGELDLCTVAQLGEAITSIPGSDVSLDLRGVTFLDAAGLGGLLQARRTLDGRGTRLHISAASRAVTRVLDLTGTAEEFANPTALLP